MSEPAGRSRRVRPARRRATVQPTSTVQLVLNGFRADLLKLIRRPAVWVLGSILLLGVFSIGYLFFYVGVLISEQTNATAPNANPDANLILRDFLRTGNFVAQALSIVGSLGGPLGLILGALAMGSEYGWGTLKTILTQRPGRLSVYGGQLLALAPVLATGVVGALATGLLASIFFSALLGEPIALPPFTVILGGIVAGWLILATWTAFGLMLATVMRSTAFAIGLGLAYALVFETAISFAAIFVSQVNTVRKFLPGANISALANGFSAPPPGSIAADTRIPPERAAIVILLYITSYLLIAALFVRQRDVI